MALAVPYWTVQTVPSLKAHSAADFAGGRFLVGPSGNHFRPLGPNNIIVATWVRLDAKPAGLQQKLVTVSDPPRAGFADGDILGVFYDGTADEFRSYGSNGVGYTVAGTVPAVHPVIGSWYLVVAEFGGTALNISVTNPAGVQVGGSVGFGGVYSNPANANLGVAALPNGGSPLSGALDSTQFWNSTRETDFPAYFGTPGAIWNNGKALDFSELPASAPPTTVLQLYLDYNEPSNAAHYADKSPNAFVLSPSGAGTITRIAGAGY